MAQLLTAKCQIVEGFKNTQKHFRMSMDLNVCSALKPKSRSNFDNLRQQPSTSPTAQVIKQVPLQIKYTSQKWIYVYLLYDRLERKEAEWSKNSSLSGSISKISLLSTTGYILLLFKANEQHGNIPVTVPHTILSLPLIDRPYKFAGVMKKNREFFRAIHSILHSVKLRQLGNLRKMPNELIDNED